MAVRVGKLSSLCWETFDRLSTSQKQELLQPYLQTREPIRRFSDIQRGDHLVRKFKRDTISSLPGSLRSLLEFEHHFLCIDRNNENKPVIIHYYVLAKNAVGSGLGSGKVQIMTLPHKDFIKNEEELQRPGAEIERVVWPVQLWRYSLKEVINKAQLREGERRYDLAQNNCENFVMWCLCGANVSLQATPTRRAWWEVVKALILLPLCKQAPHYAVHKFASRNELLNDEKFVLIACTTSLEMTLAKSDIKRCGRELEYGVISRREYQDKVSEIVILSLFRIGGGGLGRMITKILCPRDPSVFGLLIGNYSGVAVGHLFGKFMVVRFNFLWLRNVVTSIMKKDVKIQLPRDLNLTLTELLRGLSKALLGCGLLIIIYSKNYTEN